MAKRISRADQAGISTAIHAIGDRAIRELLDVYTEVLSQQHGHPQAVVPHRIEHVQHSRPEDLRRLAPLGLVASVQPLHLSDDMHMIDKACGSRARWAYAFVGGALMGYGARLARGCTSGQALSGGAVMSVGSWAFMFAVFAGGYGLAWFVRRLWQEA